MKRFILNFILIAAFALFLGTIFVSFTAEGHFDQAKKLEEDYRWEKAGEKYQLALHLAPFNAEYFAGAGDFLMRRSRYRKDRISWPKRAAKLYEKACQLNPRHAEYWYSLGQTELAHSSSLIVDSQKSIAQSSNFIAEAMENFKRAIEKDPCNFRVNYLIGQTLLVSWKSLDREERDFTLDRLRYVLRSQPWDSDFVYSAMMYYAKDFSLLQKVMPDNLEGAEILLFFIEENNLWQYRKEAAEQVDYYRQKEEPEKVKEERLARLKQFVSIKQAMRYQLSANRSISKKDWQGKSSDGESVYEGGNMYWTGTMDASINVPEGKAMVKIKAKGSPADKVFPYMIVELEGETIGATIVDSSEWKEYLFKIDTEGGIKVLSLTFVNDGGNEERNEDRNLFVGGARVEALNN